MIRKHALTLACLVIAVMIAATLWRISLLPDWSQITMAGKDGAPSRSLPTVWLFIMPAVMGFGVFAHLRSLRLAQGRPEAVQALRNFSTALMLSMCAIAAVLHGIVLGQTLGLALPYDIIARCGFVVMGFLLMLFGNKLPKLPWFTSKAVCLDDAGVQKLRRLQGLWLVALGAMFVLSGAFLPSLRWVAWPLLVLNLGGVLAIRAYARWLRKQHGLKGAAR